MSEQQSQPQRPTSDDRDAWKAFWMTQDMPWRTEPEIDEDRQHFLAERRAVTPDIQRSIYPFRDEDGRIELDRADVEWLLATHESGGMFGPVDWHDKTQRKREGLDLRGAYLREVDLGNLPLARLQAGLSATRRLVGVDSHIVLQWILSEPLVSKITGEASNADDVVLTEEQRQAAAIDCAEADFRSGHLEGSCFAGAHMEACYFYGAHLKGADLSYAYLEFANFMGADLRGVQFDGAYLECAGFDYALMKASNLAGAHLGNAQLMGVRLQGARLADAHLAGAFLNNAHLEGADLSGAHVGGCEVEGADWSRVAAWQDIHEDDYEYPTVLSPADLRGIFLDPATNLSGLDLGTRKYGHPNLADVRWGGVNLAVADWTKMAVLGDEKGKDRLEAFRWASESIKDTETGRIYRLAGSRRVGSMMRREELATAVRANRQLAGALKDQGLNEVSDRFAYRAQLLQGRVMLGQHQFARALGSWFLDLISGYGYRPLRSLGTYICVVLAFATVYFLIGGTEHLDISPGGAIVTSIVSFHGRGFFPQALSLDDLVMKFVAAEALCGLLIEITLIATFTQRFFAR